MTLRLYLTLAVDFGCKTVPGVSGIRRRRPICLIPQARDRPVLLKASGPK